MAAKTESRTVTIGTPDGSCDAFVAHPAGDGPYPAVLFYMDAIGLRPVLEDMARELASHGYYVLVPNLFYRTGPAPVVEVTDLSTPEAREAFFGKIMPLVHALTPDLALRDAGSYLDFLAAQDQVAPGPVGLTGYCMGGALAVRTAARYPDRVAAAAGFHAGHLATDAPDSPHRLAGDIRAELYFGHASQDDSMNAEHISRLESALDEAGVTYRSEVYPDTVHGYTMVDTAAYSESGLARHWEALLDLFARTLKQA
ncbi:dienelactone hydrolase family protein [Streptomyces olivaceiscleroticus]|uniref:Dienelactone hydrolase family protein n=1 Tax=Streptomyces olivaceiscleroticus TaxID=68245 RepID=A0ABP3K7X6_9ACTN